MCAPEIPLPLLQTKPGQQTDVLRRKAIKLVLRLTQAGQSLKFDSITAPPGCQAAWLLLLRVQVSLQNLTVSAEGLRQLSCWVLGDIKAACLGLYLLSIT